MQRLRAALPLHLRSPDLVATSPQPQGVAKSPRCVQCRVHDGCDASSPASLYAHAMRRALALGMLVVSIAALTGCHAFTFGTEANGRYWSHPVTVTNTTEFDFLVRIDLDCAGSPFYGYGVTTTVGQAGTSLCHRGAGGEIGVLRTGRRPSPSPPSRTGGAWRRSDRPR